MATLTCTALLDLPRRLWLNRYSRRGRSLSIRTAHDFSKRKAVLRSQQPTRLRADAHLQRRWPTSGQGWRRAVTERARRCTFTAKVRFAARRSPCCSFSFTCEHHDNTHEHATAQAHAVSLLCRHHAAQGGRDRRSPARQTRCHARRQRRSPAAGSCTPSSPPRQRTWPRDASGSACRSRLSKLGCPLPERSLEFPNWFPSTQILEQISSFPCLPLVRTSQQ